MSSRKSLNLRLTNTLGGKKEQLQPFEAGRVGMYHCGPTVTGVVNIDKFRSYLLGDILRRYLEYQGLEVRQVMNITDVGHLNEFEEDSIEITASRSGLHAGELVEREETAFHEDRRAVNILDAHVYPRAHEHVEEMIEFIGRLLAGGAAYRAGGNIFFDISRAKSLGKLSGLDPAAMEALHRGAPSSSVAGAASRGQRHPLDFDLWRADPGHQSHWQSPWGRGFPGWHVECVVMGRKYLGTTFDIHSGSEENINPHHECELAQAEALEGEPLARVWLHTRHVLMEGRTISKAHRNLISVRGLLGSGVPGPEIRGALLSAHYRQPFEFGQEAVEEAHDAIALLREFREHHRAGKPAPSRKDRIRERIARAESEFEGAMDNDLDFPAALSAVRDMAGDLDPKEVGAHPEAAEAVDRFNRVLGLL